MMSIWRVTAGRLALMLVLAGGIDMATTQITHAESTSTQDGGVPDPFRFSSDAAIIMWHIRADAAPDFELAWRVIKQRAASAGNADLQALLAGVTIYAPSDAATESVTYVFHIHPASKTGSYSPTFLLYESKLFSREEADELFTQISGALMPGSAITMMPLRPTE